MRERNESGGEANSSLSKGDEDATEVTCHYWTQHSDPTKKQNDRPSEVA